MAATPEGQFACPSCGKHFKWNEKLAGKAVACKCGQKFRIPADSADDAEPLDDGPAPATGGVSAGIEQGAADDAPQDDAPQNDADDDTYDLNLPDDLPASKPAPKPAAAPPAGAATSASGDGKCPNCNQPIKPDAVLCVKCGFNLQEGRKMQTEVAADAGDDDAPADTAEGGKKKKKDPLAAPSPGDKPIGGAEAAEDAAKQHKIVEIYLPAGLIALGVVMRFLDALYQGRSAGEGILSALFTVIGDVVLWIPLAFLAMLLAVKLLGVAFGTLGLGLYKLLAIALGPGAVWSVIAFVIPIPIAGDLAGLAVAACMYIGLLMKFFDMDIGEALLVAVFIFVLEIVVTVIGGLLALSVIFA